MNELCRTELAVSNLILDHFPSNYDWISDFNISL